MANLIVEVAGRWNKLLRSLGALGPDGEDIHGEVMLSAGAAATPTLYNVTLTLADTEYSQALAEVPMRVVAQSRDGSAFRLAYEAGKAAGSVAPFLTVPAGAVYDTGAVAADGPTLYLAGAAGDVIEIEVWR